MEKQKITEEMGLQKIWKEHAEKVRMSDEVKIFIDELQNNYEHDYGTIVHALEAVMIAAYNVLEKSPQGGITGNQAGYLGWTFVRRFITDTKGPQRVVTYEHLLYPHLVNRSFLAISKETMKWVREEAKRKLEQTEFERYEIQPNPELKAYWEELIAGKIPEGMHLEE